MKTRSPLRLLPLLLATATLAQAHPGHGPAEGWTAGFEHPFSGWDHLLAMVAVGVLWFASYHLSMGHDFTLHNVYGVWASDGKLGWSISRYALITGQDSTGAAIIRTDAEGMPPVRHGDDEMVYYWNGSTWFEHSHGELTYIRTYDVKTAHGMEPTVYTEGEWVDVYRMACAIPLICLLIPLPLILFLMDRRARAIQRITGLCLICGYDLRATPERCPECGTAVPLA